MAKRKPSRPKNTGLGLGLDALIKSKTKPVEDRDDDFLSESEDSEQNIQETSSEPIEEVVTKKTPKKRTSKPKATKSKTSKQSKSSKTKKSAASSKKKPDSKKESVVSVSSVDNQRVDAVLTEVRKNPRISLWSARSAAVLRYLKKTQPEFSISSEASKLIEEAVKDKYPEIWDIFDEL